MRVLRCAKYHPGGVSSWVFCKSRELRTRGERGHLFGWPKPAEPMPLAGCSCKTASLPGILWGDSTERRGLTVWLWPPARNSLYLENNQRSRVPHARKSRDMKNTEPAGRGESGGRREPTRCGGRSGVVSQLSAGSWVVAGSLAGVVSRQAAAFMNDNQPARRAMPIRAHSYAKSGATWCGLRARDLCRHRKGRSSHMTAARAGSRSISRR